ncbi:MAG: TIGR03790 family protein [Coraliomargaritaceae bacterium]
MARAAGCIFLQFAVICALPASEAERVVLLVNSNVPESMQVAEHYTARRDIPKENIIALPMPTTETISVREYVDSVYNPLLTALKHKGWVKGARNKSPDFVGRYRMSIGLHEIAYLVTTYGVPLRIKNNVALQEPETAKLPEILHVNRGSVDSELVTMVVPGALPLASLVRNPYFENKSVSTQDASGFLRVCRLDGPSLAVVNRLIDRTIEAERNGLQGRAYFDIGGPHKQGDLWFSAAADLAKSAHFDSDVDTSKRVMDYRDRLDAPAIYMGWYRQKAYGPWLEKNWQVPPGALGFHLHSFSATTVRSRTSGWVGPMVAQGYCMTIGNVYEPYLEYTHRPQRMLEHLLSGGTFGEAAAYSYPVASWMGIAVGDPLFRPFAVRLDEQVNHDSETWLAPYVHLRKINQIKAEVGIESSLDYTRSHFLKAPSLPLAYQLARLHIAGGDSKKAVEALKFIRFLRFFAKEEYVLVKQIADLLHENGESSMALTLYEKLLALDSLPKNLHILLLESGSDVAMAANESMIGAKWASKALQLKQPAVQ